jgi:hypothetical protein
VDAILTVPADVQLQSAIQYSIEANVKSHPESVQAALTQGMTTLTQIEARIKADSGNVNHMGIDISASHDAYMDFASGKVSIEAAATAMVGDIRAAVAAEGLTDVEAAQLHGVVTEIVGDAELAAEHIGINLHDGGAMVTEIGAMSQTYVDSENGVGDNGNVKPSNPLHDAKAHTDANIRSLIEGEGQNVNEFAALLDADRVLTPKEKELIRRVLQKIGTPMKGTEMQKVIPEKDIQKILKGKYKTVRKSVAQASHMSKLITLAEVLYGLRLDYPNSDFSFKDHLYGRIKYVVEDESSISYSIDEAGYAWPYTGKGFIGTDRVIVPEYMQTEVEYLDGSLFEIVDSRTGEVLETYKFNLDIKQWILKGGK